MISKASINSLRSLYQDTIVNVSSQLDGIILFSLFGEINQEKMESVLKITEKSILDSGSKRRIMKRICSVEIECFQNIVKHGAVIDNQKSGFIILSKIKDEFKLYCGNLVHAEEQTLIEEKINLINSLGDNELRKLYIETLCNENFSSKGGAGLGFLTIAKKSERPVEFNLLPINKTHSFFLMEISFAD